MPPSRGAVGTAAVVARHIVGREELDAIQDGFNVGTIGGLTSEHHLVSETGTG